MVSVNIVTHFICVLVLACFCIIMTMNNWASQFDLKSLQVSLLYYLYTIFFIVGMCSTAYSSFKNARSESMVPKQQDQQTFILSLGGMGIFFVGILIIDALNLTNLAYCMQPLIDMQCNMFKIAGFILFHCTKPAYLGSQLMFMVWMRYNRLNQGFALVSKIAHSINIAVNLALVIYCSSFETRYLGGHEKPYSGQEHRDFFQCNHTWDGESRIDILSVSYAACMSGDTPLLKLNRSLFPYTFPMQTQFASLAISVMIGQVAVSGHKANPELERSHRETTFERAMSRMRALIPALFSGNNGEERRPLLGRRTTNEQRAFNLNPLLVFGLFLCCIHIIAGMESYQDLEKTVRFVIVINFTWNVTLVMCTIWILRYMYNNAHAVLTTPLPSGAIVILISSACCYSLNFYKLIASADIIVRPLHEWDEIKNSTGLDDEQLRSFTSTSAIGYFLHTIRLVLQSLIIIRICRELSMTTYCLTLTNTVSTALSYLLVANLTDWVWNSAIGINQVDRIKTTYYSADVWNSLQHAFMPGAMYFQFHSFTILAEYMIAQYRYRDRQNHYAFVATERHMHSMVDDREEEHENHAHNGLHDTM